VIKIIIFCNVPINIRLSYILDSLHTTEVVQAFYCFNIDDFGKKVKKKKKTIKEVFLIQNKSTFK